MNNLQSIIEVDKLIIAVTIAVITYFLRATMADLKSVIELAQKNERDILLLKQEAQNNRAWFSEKFADVLQFLQEMRRDIKEMQKV